MEASSSTEKVMRFRAENIDLPMDFGGVRLQLLEAGDGRVQMSIVIDPETTMESVKNAWPSIRTWQGRLERFQKKYFSDSEILLFNLWQRKFGGRSYAELADYLNKKVEDHVLNALRLLSMAEPEIAPKEASRVLLSIELQRGVEDVYAMAEPLFELFLDNRTRSLFEALHEVTKAVNVFKCINSKNASVEDCLPDAIQRAAAGDPVWSKPPHPPFTADVVRDRLDYYAKQIGLPLRGGKSQ